VKSNKNDYLDAEGIAEAAQRPTTRFVSLKTDKQSDLQALHRVRDRLISRRTALGGCRRLQAAVKWCDRVPPEKLVGLLQLGDAEQLRSSVPGKDRRACRLRCGPRFLRPTPVRLSAELSHSGVTELDVVLFPQLS
jgi:transposase